jgi:hypothetical protein
VLQSWKIAYMGKHVSLDLLWKEFKRVSLLLIRDFFAAKHVSGSICAAACPV